MKRDKILRFPDFYVSFHSPTDLPTQDSLEAHCHSLYELIYVIQGHGRFFVEGVDYPMESGCFLITRPEEYHYICPDGRCRYERLVIHFSKDRILGDSALFSILDCAKAGRNHGFYYRHAEQKREIDQIIFAMRQSFDRCGSEAEEGSKEECLFRTYLTELLLLLDTPESEGEALPGSDRIREIVDYLNLHFCEPVSLEEVANLFFVHPSTLCRSFKKAVGNTVHGYVTEKRIAKAQKLILEGMNATEAAFAVGFRDYSCFYRASKKRSRKSASV